MNRLRELVRQGLLVLVVLGLGMTGGVCADDLYIGDNVNVFDDMDNLIGVESSVKRYDALSGAFVDTFVATGSGGLLGVRGMVFDSGNLLAVDQNLLQPTNGEVLKYNGSDGAFLGAIVAESVAPYAPRGMVVGPDNLIYVADMGDIPAPVGGISRYNATTGAPVDQLLVPAPGLGVDFRPRGLVFGPDGLLYASNFEPAGPDASGSIVRFNPTSGEYLGEFVSRNSSPLLRAEGIAFSPAGDLFAVSFRSDPDDTDKIIQYDGATGDLVNTIDLYQPGEDRVFAQALLFGPDGDLFVPLTNTGEVRRYDADSGAFDVFIPAGGELLGPWYLTFGNTDPATLAYVPEPSAGWLIAIGLMSVCSIARRRKCLPTSGKTT